MYWLRDRYEPDPVAMSLMRIGVALVVITDLFIRAGDLEAHYTDKGIWPIEVIRNFGWNPGYWSIHALSGNALWQTVFFIVHGAFALLLLIGYKTRFATVCLLLLTISLHNRNLFIQQAGDDLLRLVLLWGIFLPWHARFSVDAKHYKRLPSIVPGNLGYLLLIASVYFFSAMLKTSEEWRSEGSAVYYALSLEQLRLPAGDILYRYPSVMKYFTFYVFYLELLIPFLILWPSKKGTPRLVGVFLLIILHLGIGLTLYVGLFFFIGIVTAIGMLPLSRMKQSSLESADEKKTSPPGYASVFTCSFLVFLSLVINLSSVNAFGYQLRPELIYTSNALRLDQYWGMFSPGVLKEDGWFVYHGMDSVGRQWDLRLNQDFVDYKKPDRIVSTYRTDRWRKLAENMQRDKYNFLRPLYCRYVLRKWNNEHPEKKLAILNLYFMEKTNLPEYRTTPLNKKLFSVCDDR